MRTITIVLTDTEYAALEIVALDPQEWTESVVRERARVAMTQVVREELDKKLDAGDTVSGTREEIFLGAGRETAAERDARLTREANGGRG